MHCRFFLHLFVIIWLAGCASAPPPKNIDTNTQQILLSDFESWQLSGRLAFKSPEEKFSANLNWQQQQQAYNLKLTNFLGISLMTMQGFDGYAEIESDDQLYTGHDPERLIQKITGWNIPVGRLGTWIKGQAEKQDYAVFDENGLLQELVPKCDKCDQWTITFAQYEQVDALWLPHKINLTQEQPTKNKIIIRINSWQKN
jgi:outer membrane lipoprotein LolB